MCVGLLGGGGEVEFLLQKWEAGGQHVDSRRCSGRTSGSRQARVSVGWVGGCVVVLASVRCCAHECRWGSIHSLQRDNHVLLHTHRLIHMHRSHAWCRPCAGPKLVQTFMQRHTPLLGWVANMRFTQICMVFKGCITCTCACLIAIERLCRLKHHHDFATTTSDKSLWCCCAGHRAQRGSQRPAPPQAEVRQSAWACEDGRHREQPCDAGYVQNTGSGQRGRHSSKSIGKENGKRGHAAAAAAMEVKSKKQKQDKEKHGKKGGK